MERFPGHRRNGYPAVLGAILLMIAVETTVAHILLEGWSATAAWISTGLGLWSALWLIRDFRAARSNPTEATEHGLSIHVGLRWHGAVAWSDIVSVLDREPAQKPLYLAMYGTPDFWMEFAEPIPFRGPYGIVRSAKGVGIGVDHPVELRRLIEARMGATPPDRSSAAPSPPDEHARRRAPPAPPPG